MRRCLTPFIQRGLIEQVDGNLETYRVCSCGSKMSTGAGEKHSDNLNVSFVDAEGSEEVETSPVRGPSGNSGPQVWNCFYQF